MAEDGHSGGRIYRLLPTIITGIVGIIVAFISYLAGTAVPQMQLQATQTVEARLTAQAPPVATVEATPTAESTATPVPVPSPPRVALVGISYVVEDGGPYRVDLRTASTSGIPVEAGQALRLSDLWFLSPEDAPDYGVQAEIYANERLLGSTSPKPLIAGLTKLDSVQIESYYDGQYPTSWDVQPDWKDLQVFLITYRNGQVVDRNLTTIHLAAGGTAWFIEPPNVRFASIVYSVNDGSQIVLDMRDASEAGLGAGPGDKLTLQEIWYDSNATRPDHTVQAEMYIFAPPGGFNSETDQATPPIAVLRDIHKLNSEPLNWTVPDKKPGEEQFMDLTLYRDDGAVMDNLVLPLGLPGQHGLVPVK
jgi:hypothetical protein